MSQGPRGFLWTFPGTGGTGSGTAFSKRKREELLHHLACAIWPGLKWTQGQILEQKPATKQHPCPLLRPTGWAKENGGEEEIVECLKVASFALNTLQKDLSIQNWETKRGQNAGLASVVSTHFEPLSPHAWHL